MKNIYRSKNIDQLPGNCRTLIWVEKWYGMPSISKSTRSSDAHIRQYLWVIHSWWLVQRPLYLKKERKSISKLKRIIKIIKLLRNYLLTRTRVKRLVKLLNNLYKKKNKKKTLKLLFINTSLMIEQEISMSLASGWFFHRFNTTFFKFDSLLTVEAFFP